MLKNYIQKAKNKKGGFTLIELIVVIAILGVLAAILVPSVMGIVGDANKQKDQANARSVYSAVTAANAMMIAEGTPVGDITNAAPADGFKAKIDKYLGANFTGTYTVTITDGEVVGIEWTPSGEKDAIEWPQTTTSAVD